MINCKKIVSLILSGVIVIHMLTSTVGSVKSAANEESVTKSVYV